MGGRMKIDGLLCWSCCELVPYSIKERKRERIINGKTYIYVEKYGECDCCHNEITVPGLDDENERLVDMLVKDAEFLNAIIKEEGEG